MMSAAASLGPGLSLLWDTEVGLSHIDKYTYSAEEHIKVGGSLDAEYREILTSCLARLVPCSPQVCLTLVFGQKVISLLVCLENTPKTSQYH
jgi:hypothetical protein